MIFYKVIPSMASQWNRISKRLNYPELVDNELLTQKERDKVSKITDNCFEKINISRRNTFWCFGARFQKEVTK